MTQHEQVEWLEADGLGGFASGTASGVRTRRYHGVLTASAEPPTRRFALVPGVEALVFAGDHWQEVSSQRYEDGTARGPAGVEFSHNPWPRWTVTLPTGQTVIHELFVPRGMPAAVLTWRLRGASPGVIPLRVRPLGAGRDMHALHHANNAIDWSIAPDGRALRWTPYEGVPTIVASSNGGYTHVPQWHRRFLYDEERRRGFDAVEDLASPGWFEFDLSREEAVLILAADTPGYPLDVATTDAPTWAARARLREHTRRSSFSTPLARAADSYIVRRGTGTSIVAGYPWFADWGRDTFIAMRGLCIATGRLDEARSILLGWATHLSRGMLPNRFPDEGGEPEYNSVDAALWYVVAAHELMEADTSGAVLNDEDRSVLVRSILQIVAGCAAGTRHGIRMDHDGLLSAGERGQQLTWMDARVGGREITPRIGKPVEVQALWASALWIASQHDATWTPHYEAATRTLGMEFWNESAGCLYDVVDADHVRGARDASIRPNQIFAIGGLPLSMLDPVRAARVLDTIERHLLTPIGLRSLAPTDTAYVQRYEGGPDQRDAAYHQGAVWPWLMGPFIEAWLRVHGRTPDALDEARRRFLDPWIAHLNDAGLGHLCELADGQAPHTPRGCPFQAWSVGEALRVKRLVLSRRGASPATHCPESAGDTPVRGDARC